MKKHIKEERIARLSAASEQKKQDALDATQKAIRKLQQQGKIITFNAVAREAQVSTSYLYKYPELKKKLLNFEKNKSVVVEKYLPLRIFLKIVLLVI